MEAVLFDVGGVLVQVSGVDTLREWMGGTPSDEEIWSLWLRSPAVRAFESGRIGDAAFAESLIAELRLPVGPRELLDKFAGWVPGLFPGALELVEDVVSGVRRGTLSNSNALHWPRIMNEIGLGRWFDRHFVSHLTGRIKPDREAFEYAIGELGCRPDAIVFVDDNQANVDAARRAGILAHRTRGALEARAVLRERGLLRERIAGV